MIDRYILICVFLAIFCGGAAGAKENAIPVLPVGKGDNTLQFENGDGPTAIARWDVVPYRRFSENTEIGVIAFHKSGIQKVEFQANGGKIVSTHATRLNNRTKVVEYSVLLDLTGLQDQEIKVDAIAYPIEGKPRKLDTLILYSNKMGKYSGKTVYVTNRESSAPRVGTKDQPYKSISIALQEAGEGGTVVLVDPGFYSLTGRAGLKGVRTWSTIKGAMSNSRDGYRLGLKDRGLVRLDVDRLKFENLSLDIGSYEQIYPEITTVVWFDKVHWFDSYSRATTSEGGDLIPVRTSKYIEGYYVTSSSCDGTLYGFADAGIVRNSHLSNIVGDALQRVRLALNVTIDGMDGRLSNHHSDIFQYFGHIENVIVFGVHAKNIKNTQNVFLDHYKSSFKDMAFVNIVVDNQDSNPPFSQLNANQQHILFYHLTILGQNWIFRDDFVGEKKFTAKNVVFRNSILEQLKRGKHSWRGLPAGVSLINSHLLGGESFGQNTSTGKVKINRIGHGNISYERPEVMPLSKRTHPLLAVPENVPETKNKYWQKKGGFSFPKVVSGK